MEIVGSDHLPLLLEIRVEDRQRKNKVIEKVLEKRILYLTKNLKIERAVDIYDEDLFKANVGNENLEKEKEKVIELVEVGKASEAVYDLGESLRQICEIRNRRNRRRNFLITSVWVFDSLYKRPWEKYSHPNCKE